MPVVNPVISVLDAIVRLIECLGGFPSVKVAMDDLACVTGELDEPVRVIGCLDEYARVGQLSALDDIALVISALDEIIA